MQTFMQHQSYKLVAQELDDKRLGKQRVEAYQIVKALRGDYADSGAWENHPATVMWRGYEHQLGWYGFYICEEWIKRGHKDSLIQHFIKLIESSPSTSLPWWVTNSILNLTHQSNLKRKDSKHYQYNIPNDMPYIWPLPDEQVFRLGSLENGKNIKMVNDEITYLTSKQVAELLDVTPSTITAYKARGQMPKPDREYGRTPLWKISTIKRWRNITK
jgi:hypothetical protein